MTDIRWQQRFDNFTSALSQLTHGVQEASRRQLSDLEKQGLIQSFEFTHELAWNLLKDYLEYQGVFNLTGSRDTSREAFQKNLITHGDDWMDMIKSRNLTTHTYNKKVAEEIIQQITSRYYQRFSELKDKMATLIKR